MINRFIILISYESIEHKCNFQEEEKYDNIVPDLEICIADLWSSELKEVPTLFDPDFVHLQRRDKSYSKWLEWFGHCISRVS